MRDAGCTRLALDIGREAGTLVAFARLFVRHCLCDFGLVVSCLVAATDPLHGLHIPTAFP
jgi:hypothetical protein